MINNIELNRNSQYQVIVCDLIDIVVIGIHILLTFLCFLLLSAPYVKVYLIDGKNCLEKQKTTVARRTLDPLYQQQLVFTEQYVGKILQVSLINLLIVFQNNNGAGCGGGKGHGWPNVIDF